MAKRSSKANRYSVEWGNFQIKMLQDNWLIPGATSISTGYIALKRFYDQEPAEKILKDMYVLIFSLKSIIY